MDDERARLARRERQRARGERVHRERPLRLALGGVDAVVGGGVEDDVGPDARDEGRHGGRVRHVELGAAARPGELVAEPQRELAPELAGRAGHERLHAPICSASAKSRAVRPPASWVVSVSVTFE